jgi:hypothetical protein
MTTIALTPEADAFLARVREELADLPPDERDELLEDIESHLAEITGEGDVPLAVRLGSAEDFALELRHSAGLPPRAEATAPSRLSSARVRFDEAGRRLQALRGRIGSAQLWWLARGWLLAVAVAVVVGGAGGNSAWGHTHLWLPHPGLPGYGAGIALVVLIGASLWLGRLSASGRAVRLDRAATAIALVAIVPAAFHMNSPARAPYFAPAVAPGYPYGPPVAGLAFNGVLVSNIFPYTRDGKPLNDVMLFLPDGRPLPVGAQAPTDPNRRYLVTRRGQRLYNSFPVRYFDPGTSRVTHPNAGPVVHVPNILTPPLTTQKP